MEIWFIDLRESLETFSLIFSKTNPIVNRFEKVGYNLRIMRQTTCPVVNPITVNSYAALFSCTSVV